MRTSSRLIDSEGSEWYHGIKMKDPVRGRSKRQDRLAVSDILIVGVRLRNPLHNRLGSDRVRSYVRVNWGEDHNRRS